MKPLSSRRFVWRSLLFHRRINLAVALGVAAATAVLVGALLVGDSMRGSLRHVTLSRLGKIDNLLITDRSFRSELLTELSESSEFKERFDSATPAIFLPHCTLKTQDRAAEETDAKKRERSQLWAFGVFVLGVTEAFWQLDNSGLTSPGEIAEDEIVVNQPLANRLDLKLGDHLSLYMPKSGQVPPDSPLGRRDDATEFTRDLKVKAIIAGDGLGRFSLTANQVVPMNAYVSTSLLQDTLDQNAKINAILVAGNTVENSEQQNDEDEQLLAKLLRPSLGDYGLRIDEVKQTYHPDGDSEEVAFQYYHLTSDRLVIDPTAAIAAEHSFGKPRPIRADLHGDQHSQGRRRSRQGNSVLDDHCCRLHPAVGTASFG